MNGLVSYAKFRLGLELWPGQIEVLDEWAASGKSRAIFCLGRRSGKSLLSSVAALYAATVLDHSASMRRNEMKFVIVVASTQLQAREVIRVARELIESATDPDLVSLFSPEESSLDQLVFKCGATIRALPGPSGSRSVRGLPVVAMVMDEVAWWQQGADGSQSDRAMWNALSPSVAQFQDPPGYVLLTSTPGFADGLYYDLYRAATEGVAPEWHVAVRPTWAMNIGISRESLEGERRADPDSWAREYMASFSHSGGRFLNAADVHACVRHGEGTLPPEDGVRYFASIDPAFSGSDRFTLAIAHNEGDKVVVAGVWAFHRLGFEASLDEVAVICKRYGVTENMRTDQFSSAAVQEGLARRGLSADIVSWTNQNQAETWSRLKVAINVRQLSIPDDPELIGELLGLVSKQTPSGLVRVEAAGSGHDDRAIVVASLVDTLSGDSDGLPIFDMDSGTGHIGGHEVFEDEYGNITHDTSSPRCHGLEPDDEGLCQICFSPLTASARSAAMYQEGWR